MAGPFKFSPGAGTGWNMLAAGFQGASQIPGAMIQGPFLQQQYEQGDADLAYKLALGEAARRQTARQDQEFALGTIAPYYATEAEVDPSIQQQVPPWLKETLFKQGPGGGLNVAFDPMATTSERNIQRNRDIAGATHWLQASIDERLFPARRQNLLDPYGVGSQTDPYWKAALDIVKGDMRLQSADQNDRWQAQLEAIARAKIIYKAMTGREFTGSVGLAGLMPGGQLPVQAPGADTRPIFGR